MSGEVSHKATTRLPGCCRADDPQQSEAHLAAFLGATSPGLQFPLLLLTTAPDLHQGVEKWAAKLPGKLPAARKHLSGCRAVCLAAGKADKADGHYSQRALQEALHWAAAHTPPQLSFKVHSAGTMLPTEA